MDRQIDKHIDRERYTGPYTHKIQARKQAHMRRPMRCRPT